MACMQLMQKWGKTKNQPVFLCWRGARVNSVHCNSYCAIHYDKNFAKIEQLFFLQYCLCTVLTTRIKYSTLILIWVLVNLCCEWHPIFIAKSSHRIKEQLFIRAGCYSRRCSIKWFPLYIDFCEFHTTSVVIPIQFLSYSFDQPHSRIMPPVEKWALPIDAEITSPL